MTDLERVAANGLMHRRHLLGLGLAGISAGLTAATLSTTAVAAQALQIPQWSKQPGSNASAYGQPSPHSNHLQRLAGTPNPLYPGGGASRTPLQFLQGSITPNSLHFERHHAGIPAIDPSQHKLIIHGLVNQALSFSYEDLLAYPLISRIYFLECSGNSGAQTANTPVDGSAQSIHGLLSCAEWTGISLATLLAEAGVLDTAQWVSAVGADAASMGRSIPLGKALDDVFIALYQNGEPLRPEQGYPMRLFVPGWEGNTSVKWLTQLKLSAGPAQFRDETSKYTDTLPDGSSLQFTFPMGVKSTITSPSGQMQLTRHGLYQISGLAWSGHGRINKVEVSADGGSSWAEANLEQSADKALTRFNIPWQYQGQSAQLLSRASDDRGNIQPTRRAHIASQGSLNRYHYNAIQCWSINSSGVLSNAYA